MLAGIGLSLAANLQPKLRYITLDLGDFDGVEESNVVLSGLNNELGHLSEKNILEVLVVQMQVNVDSGFRARLHSSWTAWAADIDRILADIDAFPTLRKVTIELTWFVHNTELGYSGGTVDLTAAHFPRLLESTVIYFGFSDVWYRI